MVPPSTGCPGYHHTGRASVGQVAISTPFSKLPRAPRTRREPPTVTARQSRWLPAWTRPVH